jgi:hypothetical protein
MSKAPSIRPRLEGQALEDVQFVRAVLAELSDYRNLSPRDAILFALACAADAVDASLDNEPLMESALTRSGILNRDRRQDIMDTYCSDRDRDYEGTIR